MASRPPATIWIPLLKRIRRKLDRARQERRQVCFRGAGFLAEAILYLPADRLHGFGVFTVLAGHQGFCMNNARVS